MLEGSPRIFLSACQTIPIFLLQGGFGMNWDAELAKRFGDSSDYQHQQLPAGGQTYSFFFLECFVDSSYIQDEILEKLDRPEGLPFPPLLTVDEAAEAILKETWSSADNRTKLPIWPSAMAWRTEASRNQRTRARCEAHETGLWNR